MPVEARALFCKPCQTKTRVYRTKWMDENKDYKVNFDKRSSQAWCFILFLILMVSKFQDIALLTEECIATLFILLLIIIYTFMTISSFPSRNARQDGYGYTYTGLDNPVFPGLFLAPHKRYKLIQSRNVKERLQLLDQVPLIITHVCSVEFFEGVDTCSADQRV